MKKKNLNLVLMVMGILCLFSIVKVLENPVREYLFVRDLDQCKSWECDEQFSDVVKNNYFSAIPFILKKIEQESEYYNHWKVELSKTRFEIRFKKTEEELFNLNHDELIEYHYGGDPLWTLNFYNVTSVLHPSTNKVQEVEWIAGESHNIKFIFELFENDPEAVRHQLAPFFKSDSKILIAVAACFLYRAESDIRRFVPKTHLNRGEEVDKQN